MTGNFEKSPAGWEKRYSFILIVLFRKYKIITFSLIIRIFQALLVNLVKNISLVAPDTRTVSRGGLKHRMPASDNCMLLFKKHFSS